MEKNYSINELFVNKLKNSYMRMFRYLFFILTIPLLNSCNQCSNCKNNLEEYFKKVPYKNGELIKFKNDTLGILTDTIKLDYYPPSKEPYGCTGSSDENNKKCSAEIYFYLKKFNFGIHIHQSANFYRNNVQIETFFDTYDYTLTKKMADTVPYLYNNEVLKSIHRKLLQNFTTQYNEPNIIEYYYSLEPKIRILQYTIIDSNGIARVWKLQ